MRTIIILVLVCYAGYLFAQKKILDTIAFKQWPSLGFPELNCNGKYTFYTIRNIPHGNETLVVQASDGRWKKEFIGGLKNCRFTADGKTLLFIKGKDSLGILNLGTDHIKYQPNISDFNLQVHPKGEWLCFSPTDKRNVLILRDLNSNQDRKYEEVTSWEFSRNGKILILIKHLPGDLNEKSLYWVNTETENSLKVWKGHQAENLIVDQGHQQLVFKTIDSVWYYKPGLSAAIPLIGIGDVNKDPELIGLNNFSIDGTRLFVTVKGGDKPAPKSGAVEVWSYQDMKLQSEGMVNAGSDSYLGVIDLKDHKFVCLQQNSFERFYFPAMEDTYDTLALVRNNDRAAEPWSINSKTTWSLISVKSGQKRSLDFLDNSGSVSISPCGKYLLYYSNGNAPGYFSYEIASGKIRNLTGYLNVIWWDLNMDDRYKSGAKYPRGFDSVIWLKNDSGVLVYDQYDIWKLDPLNIEKPVNLTNAYGRKHGIVFRFTFNSVDIKDRLSNRTMHYLNAFDIKNKNNGFYLTQLDKAENPKLLTMGPYIFCTNSVYVPQGSDFNPIKSKHADSYLVRRMSATASPNYFSTKDFKTYIRLSDLYPEKEYRWLNSELHTWKSLDGRELKGILYKPENFDPHRRYPVIFHYYERKSDGLNAFLKPDLSEGNLDIPTYVSQGYIVFCPDIYYSIGNPMQGTYDAVISAANYVSNLPFINARKMAIQGHSFGAVQTNYLITHTSVFAAAVSASGIADCVSHYGGGFASVSTFQDLYENGQARMGGSLWEKSEAYIKSSAIFRIDKITTPLLIMHGKKDGICPFNNALEFFTGLRRLGKRAWMLAYPNGGHGLTIENDAADFSKRMMQFFDHYLKDKPVPVWMTIGIDKGFDYDMKIQTPGPGILKPEELVKVDSLMKKESKTIMLQ